MGQLPAEGARGTGKLLVLVRHRLGVAARRVRQLWVRAAPVALLSFNYVLALLLVKKIWFLAMPWREYLTSVAGWPQFIAPLLIFIPGARVVPQTVLALFRNTDGGLRTSVVAGSLFLSMGLVAAGPAMRPRIELALLEEDIDRAGVTSLDEVDAPTVRADRLCPEPELLEEADCHLRLPAKGYLQVRIRLGRNRLPAYRLQLKAEPEGQVAFARIRADRSMGVGGHPERVKTAGSELTIASGESGSEVLTGTVEIRVLCRWLPGSRSGAASLRVQVAKDAEGKEVIRELEQSWPLLRDAAGAAGRAHASDRRS